MNVSTRITTITSRQFNQDTASAKRAAEYGPVFVTTRGEPTHVLISKQDYDRLENRSGPPAASREKALADTSPEGDFDFAFPEFKDRTFRGYEFD